MMNSLRSCFRPYLPLRSTLLTLTCFNFKPWQQLSQSLLVGILSALGAFSGLTPDLSGQSAGLFPSSAAYAQSQISDAEVRQFAPAAYKIEQQRQILYNAAKRSMNPVPANLCSLSNLPNDLPSLCSDFVTLTDKIIKDSGLSAARFYEIYRRQANESDLRARVEREIIRCQKESACR